ncbi:MAG: hypothetical protein HZB61_12145 [Nitrospirae bacterium]|nr:hypothetical protein [Nitrospirota bacterium]
MSNIQHTKTYQYINDFMYFILKPDKSGNGALIYCSGVNLTRFLPITKGRHRPMSNPAMRGLQLVNIGVRDLALSSGATPKAVPGINCTEIVPVKDGWFTERLLIENAPDSLPDAMINYCVINLLKKIFNAIYVLQVELPDKLLVPDELQDYIDGLCRKFGS